jgi:hypothetical protein
MNDHLWELLPAADVITLVCVAPHQCGRSLNYVREGAGGDFDLLLAATENLIAPYQQPLVN